MKRQGAAEQAPAVVFEAQPEGLGESSGTHCDQCGSGIDPEPSKAPHPLVALEWFCRAQQDGRRPARSLADDVDAGVDPVAAIGVQASGRAKHRPVAVGLPGVGMGGGVAAVAEISLDLGNSNHEPLAAVQPVDDPTTDQICGDAS